MFRALITMSLALSVTNQACAIGCMKCNAFDQCLISDTNQQYYLQNGVTTKSDLTNCQIIIQTGSCILCDSGYYLDPNANMCVALATNNLIDNCQYYSASNSCSVCNSGFYVNANRCVAVQTSISNCNVYSSASTCSVCNNGYLLKFDSSSCIAAPSIANCEDFTFVKCNSCDSGYVISLNQYMTKLLASDSVNDRTNLAQYAFNLQDKTPGVTAQLSCEIQNTKNCATFAQYANTCTMCSTGYFLDTSGLCVVYPDEPIENCVRYSSTVTCSQCVEGYYLKSNGCEKIPDARLFANCTSYNTSSFLIICISCSDGYYLASNTCTARIKSTSTAISNCATFAIAADQCVTCVTGFVLSLDGLQCNPVVENCSTYADAYVNQPLNCKTCISGYYLTNTTIDGVSVTQCLIGTIANCDQYNEGNATSCAVCSSDYYLSDGVCTAHNSIKNCVSYSQIAANTCLSCDSTNSLNFVVDKICQDIATPIPKCASYNGGTLQAPTCSACESNYYLTNNTCAVITIVGCLEVSGSICLACQQNFALNFDSTKCIAPFEYISDRCQEDSTFDLRNTESAKNVVCNYCKQNALPFNFYNHFVCIPSNGIVEYTSGQNKIVAGCLKYDRYIRCIQCNMETSTPYLDTSSNAPTCVANCGANPYFKYKLSSDGQISQFNVCYNATVDTGLTLIPSCRVYAPDITGAIGDYICIACSSTGITVVDTYESSYSNIDPTSFNFSTYFPFVFAKFPEKSCPNVDGIATISGVATKILIANCSYYIQLSTNNYSCLKCEHGYSGTINTANYIDACAQDNNCSSDKVYNLDAFINNIASCHRCLSISSIPFIVYDGTSNTDPTFVTFRQHSTTRANGVFDLANGTQPNIACRANSASTFGITGSYGVNTNCGIAVLLSNTDGTGDGVNTFGTFCAACKPGFKATSNGNYPYVKTACTQIQNCNASGSLFNACSSCSDRYVYSYDATSSDVLFDTCLAIPTSLSATLANCFAALPGASVATNAFMCAVCKRGYFLNADKLCETILPVNCSTGFFRFSTPNSQATLNWSLWLNGNAVGCNRCNNNFLAVRITTNHYVCLASTYAANSINNLTASQTAFIPNCKNYYVVNNSLKCKACNSNFIINGSGAYTLLGTRCIAAGSNLNCDVASDVTVCLKCISNAFALVSNKCTMGNIVNCVSYNFDTNKSIAACTQCAADYYLDTVQNVCTLGYIYNCARLKDDSPNNCITCAQGFILTPQIGGGIDVCYPVDQSLGCGTLTLIGSSSGGRVSCTSCAKITQLPIAVSAKSNQTICMLFASIPNCLSYNVSSTLVASYFTCKQCTPNYYLKNNRCIQRNNKPAKCILYSGDEDKCLGCDPTSFSTKNSTACSDYPQGIIGCMVYLDVKTCISCKAGRYLKSNTCPVVTTPIANCAYYSSSTFCSTCAYTYVLINNACVKSTATNCATYATLSACFTCMSGYVLDIGTQTVNCISMTKTGCSTLNINPPYNCLACEDSYYLDAGQCKSPNNILNCAAYSSQTTCSQCVRGYVLSSDSTSCTNSSAVIAFVDSKCTDAQIMSTPICSRCSAGYYFVNGLCTGTCGSNDTSGCLACNIIRPNECFICSTEYYQDKSGNCNPSFSTSNISSVSVYGMSIVFAMIICFIYN